MSEDTKSEKTAKVAKAKGGGLKRLTLLLLCLVMAYLGLHVYFIWQPANKTSEFGQALIDAEVAGVKFFPAIQAYSLDDIAGRSESLAGGRELASPLPKRLETAIERNEPVTFEEKEVNIWLRKRLHVEQKGLLADYAEIKGVWVNFTPGEIEFVIEREIEGGFVHVVSLFMKFVPTENGFSIYRHASHVGQVKLPGGFARLVMPGFSKMAEELTEELKLYRDDALTSNKALKIHDIQVEHGQITLDPRLASEKLTQ